MPVADDNILGQWNRRPFRKPDHEECHYAIWYGPGDADGDFATTVSYEDDYFVVTEYSRHPDDGELITQSTQIGVQLVRDTVLQEKGFKPATNGLHLWATSIGVAALAYYGGDEDTAIDLPRGNATGPFWCGHLQEDEGLPVDDDLEGVQRRLPAWTRV
jgi:hypothetical protein